MLRPNGDGIVANGLGVLAVFALFVDCDDSRFDGGLPMPFDGRMLGSFEPNGGIFDPAGGGELGLATRGIGFGGSNVPALGATGNGDASDDTVLGGGVVRGAFGGGNGDFAGVAVGAGAGDFVVDVGRGDDAGGLLNAVGASCSSGAAGGRGATSLGLGFAPPNAVGTSSLFVRAKAVGTSLSEGGRAPAIWNPDAAYVGGSDG